MQGVDCFLKDSLRRKQELIPHHILPPCPHTLQRSRTGRLPLPKSRVKQGKRGRRWGGSRDELRGLEPCGGRVIFSPLASVIPEPRGKGG